MEKPAYELSPATSFIESDLRSWDTCLSVTRDVSQIYHLAANMGGIGYITKRRAEVAADNLRIDAQMLQASSMGGVGRLLFASSACVYPLFIQNSNSPRALVEADAHPADPEDGYGWAKLMTEKMCEYYRLEGLVDTRIARVHNIFGPGGVWEGGKEKAPAAICRKVAMAESGSTIEVWGDGKQVRSYCVVDDAVEAVIRLMSSDYADPVNIGQGRAVTISELVQMVCLIAGKELHMQYCPNRPMGVRYRNADISLAQRELGWRPAVSLEAGLAATYAWVHGQMSSSHPRRRRDAR
jgi:nucleoside-diphosphate-sugar epimerase